MRETNTIRAGRGPAVLSVGASKECWISTCLGGDYWTERMGRIGSPEYYGSSSRGSSEYLRPVLVRGGGERGRGMGRELFRDDRTGSNRAVDDRVGTLPPVCSSGSGLRVSSKVGKKLSADNRLELGEVV
jgi:hypothetical protein